MRCSLLPPLDHRPQHPGADEADCLRSEVGKSVLVLVGRRLRLAEWNVDLLQFLAIFRTLSRFDFEAISVSIPEDYCSLLGASACEIS